MRDDARGKDRNPAGHSRRARIFANVCLARSDEECPGRGRSGGPPIQLNTDTAGTPIAAVGQFWKGRPTGANSREDQSRNARWDDWHDSVARESLHEHI